MPFDKSKPTWLSYVATQQLQSDGVSWTEELPREVVQCVLAGTDQNRPTNFDDSAWPQFDPYSLRALFAGSYRRTCHCVYRGLR